MSAVFKREFHSYFLSPIGYVFLAVFWFFSGFYFFSGVAMQNTSSLSPVFESVFLIIMLLIPILTMRLFSEEYKSHTDQLLFSTPVSLTFIVVGKYLAAFAMFAVTISITLAYALTVAFLSSVEVAMLVGNLLGLLLLGSALISIGLFVSSLTKSQIIAALGSFGIFLIFMYMDSFAQLISIDWIKNLLFNVSFMTRYRNFTSGLLNIADIIYFISVTAIFLFLSVRVLEKKRWS